MQKHAKMNKCCNSTQEIKIPIAQELKDDAATYQNRKEKGANTLKLIFITQKYQAAALLNAN